jgi:16S rRNA G966 N2-methylase RsmD
MWSYYGTKKRIAKYYPSPEHDIIIEPFCGAAQYSLFANNWQKQVYLIDKYDVIVNIWKYLIQANQDDILKLPNMHENDNINKHTLLLEEERNLIGFCINCGSASPKKTVKKFNSWNKTKNDIANNLYKIRHWKIKQDDYFNINNVKATWYIDPPYQYGGQWYKINNKTLNYANLAEWCKKRMGQVIVCENTKATWMDFKPLVELNGQLHKTVESIWYKN